MFGISIDRKLLEESLKYLSDRFSDTKWLWKVTFQTRPAPKSHGGCLSTPFFIYHPLNSSTASFFIFSTIFSSQISSNLQNFSHTNYRGPQNRKKSRWKSALFFIMGQYWCQREMSKNFLLDCVWNPFLWDHHNRVSVGT